MELIIINKDNLKSIVNSDLWSEVYEIVANKISCEDLNEIYSGNKELHVEPHSSGYHYELITSSAQ